MKLARELSKRGTGQTLYILPALFFCLLAVSCGKKEKDDPNVIELNFGHFPNVRVHYIQNDKRCEDGGLVLMDIGTEYGNYNSDMTLYLYLVITL